MKKNYLPFILMAICFQLIAQTPVKTISEAEFFSEQSIIDVTITLDMRTMFRNKLKEGRIFPANFIAKFENNSEVSGPILLEVRGKYRRKNCYMPPLKVYFKNKASPVLSPLGSLKLVNPCRVGNKNSSEYVMKEYLTYKMYNLFTDKSLRVRLLRLNYVDSLNKRKTIQEYGYLIEDVDDMAKRNECIERKIPVRHSEHTNRQQMTKVAIFEYMIGNSDWSVPARHNIKLIVPKDDTTSHPFPVPYDFDHSGLVKTDYALPPPSLEITDVTQRSYRGYARVMEELTEAAEEFLSKKESVYSIVRDCAYITENTKEKMLSFLNEFFVMLTRPSSINYEFIQNARRD